MAVNRDSDFSLSAGHRDARAGGTTIMSTCALKRYFARPSFFFARPPLFFARPPFFFACPLFSLPGCLEKRSYRTIARSTHHAPLPSSAAYPKRLAAHVLDGQIGPLPFQQLEARLQLLLARRLKRLQGLVRSIHGSSNAPPRRAPGVQGLHRILYIVSSNLAMCGRNTTWISSLA
jgi:hypothetical protein